MKKTATAFPTKEDIKTARAVMRKVQAARMKKYYVRRHRRVSTHDREFFTWTHDMRTVLSASARELVFSPGIIADRAHLAADSMAKIIAERKPPQAVEVNGHVRRDARGLTVVSLWYIWQELFDGMIHEMAAKSELAPHVIVDRARRIADAAMLHIKRRYRR